MSSGIQKQYPLFLLGIVGGLIIAELFIEQTQLASFYDLVSSWAVIVIAFATGVGITNLTKNHVNSIVKRTEKRSQWIYSSILLAALYIPLLAGIIGGTQNIIYNGAFTYIYTPLNATIYAMLAFWIVSAAYRAMRARSSEAAILLVVALFIMMKDTPLIITYLPIITDIGNWLSNVPIPAGNRGLLLSAGLGALIFGLRTILGKNPKSIGVSEEI
jgi:hypothetical protein